MRIRKIGNACITGSFIFLLSVLVQKATIAQDPVQPVLRSGRLTSSFTLDGLLFESDWMTADSIVAFTMVEPGLDVPPTYQTTVKVLADQKYLYIGLVCYDSEPGKIVSFSKARDADLGNEDNIKIVLDPYFDGRNGFIFSVNPFGARYDAIISANGERENMNWDGVWDARTCIGSNFWSVEIMIPVSSLTYKRGSVIWGFNAERRIQRHLEVSRWTAINRNYTIGQTIHSGALSALPDFNIGIGMIPQVSLTGKASHKAGLPAGYALEPSLDVIQKITPDITAQLTVNTDFAETEVDSRRTNLTRFPLLFPEKRQFFLEGADIYDFGLGLGRSFVPFFSRRIGLYKGNEIPVRWGGKINGKVNRTHFGGLVNQTAKVDSGVISDNTARGELVPQTTMGLVRLKRNILRESSFGMITTLGDPSGLKNSFATGVDFTYQTSTFRGNKNFMAGIWGFYNDREGLSGDKSAFGIKIDYPNDLWDISFTYNRFGDGFKPSLSFLSRNGVNYFRAGANYMPRPENGIIRQHIMQSSISLYTDLDHQWESYDIFTAPVHFLLESGDRFEFNIRPQGENLKEPFEIAEGVIIDSAAYHWMRYRLEVETASKRTINGMATWWFGGFYGGSLHQIQLQLNWRPISTLILEVSYEKNMGKLPFGTFVKELIATRLLVNMTSNLNFSTYIQYDNESRSVGSYSRFRWTFAPRGDLFIVYKHNINNDITNRLLFDSNQIIIKLSYGIAM